MSVAPTAAFLWGWGLTGEAPRERQEWGMAAFLPSPPPTSPGKLLPPRLLGAPILGKLSAQPPPRKRARQTQLRPGRKSQPGTPEALPRRGGVQT